MKNSNLLIILFLGVFVNSNLYSQKTTDPKNNDPTNKVNQVDNKGRKQGVWKKIYQNGTTAYECKFKDDKPVGEYKRYHENGQVNALMMYDNKGYASAKIFDEDGNLVAEGFYSGKDKDSTWKYYTIKKQLMAQESYKKGKKHGYSIVYGFDGNVYTHTRFIDGLENGIRKKYFPGAILKTEEKVTDGKLNGYCIIYNEDGTLAIKGNYKDNLKHGVWTYQGTKKKEIEYVMGKAKNQDILDSMETKQLNDYDKQKDKFANPEQYMNNPEEFFMRKN